MKPMKKPGGPLDSTVNRKGEVLDAGARKVACRLDAVASIRRGLVQAQRGEGRKVDEVFDDLELQP